MEVPRFTKRAVHVVSLLAALTASPLLGQGPLVGVSIPVGSQDATCFPLNEGVWSVTAPPFPLNVGSGIGRLLDPAPGSYASFSMHDHVYTAPNVPDPTRAVVDYVFRWPVTVTGVEILQHTNGITKIECYAGFSAGSLASLGGAFFGPAGDITGYNIIPEFSTHLFQPPTTACGTHFRVVVRKTSHVDGWATYRLFPRDASGLRIPIASAAEALTTTATSLSMSAGFSATFGIQAPLSYASGVYILLGSTSGSCPGLPFVGYGTAPLGYDLFTAYTLTGPYVPEMTGYVGFLNGAASATAAINIAPGAYPTLVGVTFTHAFAATNFGEVLFSNPVSFTIAP
jgi:hypothetical protein